MSLSDEVRFDAEIGLLATLLNNPENALPLALEAQLKTDDFLRESHGLIYQAIRDLYQKGSKIDLITVSQALNSSGQLKQAGGSSYLAELSSYPSVTSHVPDYAEIIINKSLTKLIRDESLAVAAICRDDPPPPPAMEILNNLESTLYALRDRRKGRELVAVSSMLPDIITVLNDSVQGATLRGLSSGYGHLDEITGGFKPSDLIILAARPSMGKTALALNLSIHAAIPALRHANQDAPGVAVAIFSLEMSSEQLVHRLLCQISNNNLNELVSTSLASMDGGDLKKASELLSSSDLYIDDTPGIRPLELRAKARRLASGLLTRGKKLGLIVIDYLQLMRGDTRNDSREQEISSISRSLKILAKELNIPVIALAQLNRKLEDRKDKRPMLSDLRESGAIEQDADLIMFVYRPEVYDTEKLKPELEGVAELIIGKHRNGKIGTIDMIFKGYCSTFLPSDKRVEVF